MFQHMIRYRYLPFTHSKPKYQGHDESGKVIRAKWLLNGEEVGLGIFLYFIIIKLDNIYTYTYVT
jgi:hypothetical protein